MQRQKVIAVVGPTASGKSALGAYLARKLHGEVISADSRQVYRGMRVISRADKAHMVGVADPRKQFSAGAYVQKASWVLGMIYHTSHIPIVVGGTGFYADALLGRMPLPQVPPDPTLRKRLNKRTPKQLLAQLRRLDPQAAKRVDPANLVRLVRAIEIAKGTTKQKVLNRATGHASRRPKEREEKLFAKPEVLWLGLRQPKNLRTGVEERLRRGMVAEARRLRNVLPRRRWGELGFEFSLLAEYLDNPDVKSGPRLTRRGKMAREKLINDLVRGERKYAIRQMRWFKRNPDIHWVAGKAEALRLAKTFLKK